MKAPLAKHYCTDKQCGWEEANHKHVDGHKCTKCGMPIISEIVKKE